MCVSGRPIAAADALAAGLLDRAVDGDLVEEALAFAREVAERGLPPKTRERGNRLGTPPANAPLFDAARALAAKIREEGLRTSPMHRAYGRLPAS